MEEIIHQLKALPEEKRKVIVLVGRHLNEGTLKIAMQEHSKWEKVGAVAIQIPNTWTPNYLYAKARIGKWKKEKLLSEIKKTPDDYILAQALESNGFKIPIVAFHSTPDSYHKENEPVGRSRLKLFINADLSSIPPIVEYLHDERPFFPHNIVLAEFHVKGKKRTKPIESQLMEFYDHPAINKQLKAYPLVDNVVSNSDLELYSANHSLDFRKFLDYLGRAGLLGKSINYQKFESIGPLSPARKLSQKFLKRMVLDGKISRDEMKKNALEQRRKREREIEASDKGFDRLRKKVDEYNKKRGIEP